MAERNAGREEADEAGASFLSWAILHERQTRGITVLDDETVNRICSLAVQMIFAMTHNFTLTLSNALLLLVSAPPDREYVRTLAAEVRTAAASAPSDGPGAHTWTKKSISALRGLDSALRESMRLEPVSMVMPVWRVAQDVALPCIDGRRPLMLRKGTTVTLPAYMIQTSEEKYPRALDYDALRFVDSAMPLSTPSSSFLAWSVRRTACPGRYLAASTMKLMLAVMVSEYEIKPGHGRDERTSSKILWRAGPIQIPNIASTLVVKRVTTAST